MTDPFGNTFDSHVLLPVSATDPLSNTVFVQNDYRLLTAREVTDPNGNRNQVAFDTRGVVVKSAIMGKVGDGDGDGGGESAEESQRERLPSTIRVDSASMRKSEFRAHLRLENPRIRSCGSPGGDLRP